MKMDVLGMKKRVYVLQYMVILNALSMLMKMDVLGMKIHALLLQIMVILNASSMLMKMDVHIETI
jgi:hypothetical protein